MKLSCAAFLLATPAHAGILNMFRNEEQKLATTGDVAFGHSRRLKAQPDTALVDTDKAVPNQVFYIPLPENDVYYDALKKIQPGRDQNGKLHVSGKMVSLVSVAISTDQTVIWYDHWEDGYEGDATHAISTNTNIWGDGIASNGCRPDIAMVKTCTDEDDVLNAGDSFVIESKVPVPRTSSNWFESGLKLDGGDKMMSSYPITVTRGEYAEKPGSLLAGAVEVYDTTVWGTEFDAPVGQDFGTTTEAFQYSRFFIMSGSNGNKVTLPDGSTPTLNEGQTINFSVNMGDKVTSEEPLQVYLLTGDPGSTYEMRWFSIMPTSRWSDSYLAAVGDDFARTKALMFNPGSAPITVKLTYLDDKGAETSENISLPSKKSKYTRIIPTGSGGKIESKGNVFYALSVTDTEMYTDKNNGGTEELYGQAFDWGYPLQPINMLTSQVLIGWGYGCTSNDCQGKTERSAVWVSPMDDIDLYVDYQNTGSGYDVMEVAKYQSVMVRDTSDHDMSGAILFATAKGSGPDGTPVDFASAWGQDPAVSRDTQSISLDLGTAVLPFPTVRTSKVVDKTTAAPGDILTYTITVQNVGQSGILAGKYKIVDPLPPMTTFVESYGIKYSSNGGTSFSSLDLSRIDVGSTAFPLDEGGLPSQAALPRRGGVHQLKFQVLVDPELVDGSVVTNSGYIDAPFGGNVKFEASTKLVYAPDITISNVVYLGDKGALGCDGASENVTDVTGSGVTYCFAITNVGSTYLDSVVVENDDLGIVAGDLTVPKLAPGWIKTGDFQEFDYV